MDPMTIHYHGTPITPNAVMHSLAGACFCVSHFKNWIGSTRSIQRHAALSPTAYALSFAL